MTRKIFKKAISLVCAVALVMSVVVVAMSSLALADTTVTVRYNVNGKITEVEQQVGDALKNELAPNETGSGSQPDLYFKNWCTDSALSNTVTTVPEDTDGDGIVKLYAKYNYIKLTASSKGYSGASANTCNIMEDPDDYTNMVYRLFTLKGARNNFEFAAYDDAEVSTPYILKPSTTYLVSFKVKVAPESKTGEDTNMQILTGTNPNGGNAMTVHHTTSLDADMKRGWTTKTLTFTTTKDLIYSEIYRNVENRLYAAIYSSLGSATIYIDDIIFGEYEVEGEGDLNVVYNVNGKVTYAKQNAGDDFLLQPGVAGLKFLGWATDIELTNIVDKIPEDTDGDNMVKLYAKFNYVKFTATSGFSDATDTKTTYIMQDPENPKNSVVRLPSGNGRNNFELPAYDEDGNTVGYTLKPNTTYFVSYKMKYLSEFAVKVADTTLCTGTISSWSPSRSQKQLVLKYCTANWYDKWVTVSYTFTTNDTLINDETKGNIENHLYITLYGQGENCVSYVDDIIYGEYTGEEIPTTTQVRFATNSTPIPNIECNPGDVFDLPENPKLSGYKFVGWYTDNTLETPYVEPEDGLYVVPQGGLDLYAKWEKVDTKVDFENNRMLPIFSSNAIDKVYTVEKDTDGNAVLVYDTKANESEQASYSMKRGTLVDENGEFLKLINGMDYEITFRYKVVESWGTGGDIGFYSNSEGDIWVAYDKEYTSQAQLISYQNAGGWINATYKFTATPTEDGECLALAVSGDARVYFDDFRLIPAKDTANIYEATIKFVTNGGDAISDLKGVKDTVANIPTPTRKYFKFLGWYYDEELTKPADSINFPNYGSTIKIYAKWMMSQINEGFESFPSKIKARGFSGAYTIYSEDNDDDFDATNVHGGKESVFRKGNKKQNSGFVICRDTEYSLVNGETYTISIWVKPTKVTKPEGTISIMTVKSLTNINKTVDNIVVAKMSDLKLNEWQKITYTMTVNKKNANYLGIYTTYGNDMYFDDASVILYGYTPVTGDNSMSPLAVSLIVIMSVGALLLVGKKVFVK